MDLKLRPEHWILLGVIVLCGVLVVLQMGQSWSFPALARLTRDVAAPGSGREPTSPPLPSEAAPDASAEAGGGGSGEDTDDAGAREGIDPQPPADGTAGADSGTEPTGEPAPGSEPPAAAAPRGAGEVSSFAFEVWPEPVTLADLVSVVIRHVGSEAPVEISFLLVYESASLEFIPDAYEPLEALSTEQGPPQMSLEPGEAGRLKIRIRRQKGAAPGGAAGPQLCYVQLKPLRAGATKVRLEEAEMVLTDGTHMRTAGTGKSFEIK